MRQFIYKGWIITINYRSSQCSAKRKHILLQFDTQAEARDAIDRM